MPQISTITSESLQAQIRRLLPSQQGFGLDLEASNVITPIIDLTPTAEGSQLPEYLQTAYSFGTDQFAIVGNTSSDIVTTTGFYRVRGTSTLQSTAGLSRANTISLIEGATVVQVYADQVAAATVGYVNINSFDLVVFLRSGQKITVQGATGSSIRGTTQQVADLYGNLSNPVGFTFE